VLQLARSGVLSPRKRLTAQKTVVIAIGGNSLIKDKQHERIPDQYQACVETCRELAPLLLDPKLHLIVTHGNGPQVGFILRRSELASKEVPPMPLDSCVAGSQGGLGFLLQLALLNEFRRLRMERIAATLVTLCLVNKNDPAFGNPTKPIGSFMSKEEADLHRAVDGWQVVEDSGRGWRRVIASPLPIQVVEIGAIRSLLNAGFVVIAAGGGGIAVVENEARQITGAPAVIDKDFTASLLARELRADFLVISTAVEKVCLRFGTVDEKPIDVMTVADARRYIAAGHFESGSMLPKIEASIAFVQSGGREAIITDPTHVRLAINGSAGTHIVR
jgi:carbamate kinase